MLSPAALAPTLVVYAGRDRARALVRAAFPKRRTRTLAVRTSGEMENAFRRNLVDAAIVDLGSGADDLWKVAGLSLEYPSAPFFGVLPLRSADGPALARAAALEFADVLVEGVDDGVVRELVQPRTFTARFAAALSNPPASVGLNDERQHAVWRIIVGQAGRPIRTGDIADAVGLSREHLSRVFSSEGAPNLKRVIDLVRLIAAAELAKNPGYDVRDVAAVLGFASSSHLSSTSQRIVGTRPASLARLRTVDLVERFSQGRGRSRR
ncbi:MAG: helix-turn-helix domain-containing protein [Gemmatimonadaceae bacterium]